MIESTTLVMYEKAVEIQSYFSNTDNRIGKGVRRYNYIWLPESKHFEDMIPHKNLIELDNKFDDFKRMFYEDHWFDNDNQHLEGRGEDPFVYFHTYNELWLGFVMMDRYQKRWDGNNWVTTDIYPDYFKMNKEIARRDGYPDPDKLRYIPGLRGYVEE